MRKGAVRPEFQLGDCILFSFSRSLFDEARKYGVKVVTIFPDMTQTNLYRNADFREESCLLPEEAAGAVEFALIPGGSA